jgi:hypothetical protein
VARLTGTPYIAASDSELLLTFAARNDEQGPWQAHAATFPHGALPRRARPLPITPEPGASVISPSAAPLGDDSWLLQWTEGTTGQYRVRGQVFTSALRPASEVLTLSPAGANAGQGLVVSAGKRAAAFYLVSAGKHHELWATGMECR